MDHGVLAGEGDGVAHTCEHEDFSVMVEAIECIVDASAQKPTDEEEKELVRLWTVCFANRAAAWLMEGPGQDGKKALEDATEAVGKDENYAKG